MLLSKEIVMRKYFGENKGWFFGDSYSLEHRAKYGTANSTSEEKGTDNKKNNTSEYNHNYYMKHKNKWKGTHSEWKEGDKDFDESNYSEKNRLGDTDFYGFQKEDGSWVILEEDMKFTIPKGMDRAEIIKKLEEFDKMVEAKRQSGEKYTHDDWVNAAKNALRSDSEEKEFDVDAAARDVIRGKYKNGAERKAALGDDYDLVQKRVNELMKNQKSSGSKNEEKSEKKEESGKTRTFDEASKDYYKNKQKAKSAADAAQEKGKKQTEYYKKKQKK